MIVDERTLQLLAASTRFGDVREVAEVDSTNRYLLDLARGGAPEGVVVVADYQTRGRGRLGRSWEAPRGTALLASILLRPHDASSAPDRRWLVPAAVALATAEACRPQPAEIKWPNDLLIGDAKLAGILAEADAGGLAGRSGAVVVGIGINVSSAPPGAASLGPSVDRGQLLAALLQYLEGWCDRWDEVGEAYRRRCATVGRQVRVDLGDRVVEGRAEAVEADGRLRVSAPEGTFAFSAADVTHLRPGAQLL